MMNKLKFSLNYPELLEHVIKIGLSDLNNPNLNHWMREVSSYLRKYCEGRLKNGKYLPADRYFDVLFNYKAETYEEFSSYFDSMFNSKISEYRISDIFTEQNKKNLYLRIRTFYSWLSNILSKKENIMYYDELLKLISNINYILDNK